MSVSDDLNMLIGHYGLVEVHKTLLKRMSDDYAYLKVLFEPKESKSVKPVVESVAPVIAVTATATTVVEAEESEKKKFKDSKEQKLWQREMEEKKRKENLTNGVSLKDLLTKENLKKWIEEEGRTYSYIAREYTGCKDIEVSAAAKKFEIENTRKNVTIQSKK